MFCRFKMCLEDELVDLSHNKTSSAILDVKVGADKRLGPGTVLSVCCLDGQNY